MFELGRVEATRNTISTPLSTVVWDRCRLVGHCNPGQASLGAGPSSRTVTPPNGWAVTSHQRQRQDILDCVFFVSPSLSDIILFFL